MVRVRVEATQEEIALIHPRSYEPPQQAQPRLKVRACTMEGEGEGEGEATKNER